MKVEAIASDMHKQGMCRNEHENKMFLLETKLQTLEDELVQQGNRMRLKSMRILSLPEDQLLDRTDIRET